MCNLIDTITKNIATHHKEKFVEECNVGADAWRRTGLLTFDSNVKVGKKCTYKRIQEHLQSVYNRKFSYGTVVQLCAVRNRRCLSAKRYEGVAQSHQSSSKKRIHVEVESRYTLE